MCIARVGRPASQRIPSSLMASWASILRSGPALPASPPAPPLALPALDVDLTLLPGAPEAVVAIFETLQRPLLPGMLFVRTFPGA